MTPHPSPAHEATGDEKLPVHNWRVARLTGLGIPGPLAELNAGHLDFGDVAAALREHVSATLDQHCCYFRRPD